MINEKLSQALKGNTNAAKNHVKKGMTAIENASKNAKVTAGKVFATTVKSIDSFNDKAINVRQDVAGVTGAVVGAPLGALAGAAAGYYITSKSKPSNDPKSDQNTKLIAIGGGAYLGAILGAGIGAKAAKNSVNYLNTYPEKVRQAAKAKIAKI